MISPGRLVVIGVGLLALTSRRATVLAWPRWHLGVLAGIVLGRRRLSSRLVTGPVILTTRARTPGWTLPGRPGVVAYLCGWMLWR